MATRGGGSVEYEQRRREAVRGCWGGGECAVVQLNLAQGRDDGRSAK
jgi:hypothetical protein